MLSDRPKVVSGQGTNSGVQMTQEAEDSTRPEMVQQSKHDRRTIPTEKLFNRWDWFIFSVLTALSSFAIVAFLFYWFSLQEDWQRHPIILSILTLAFVLLLVNNQGRWLMLPWMRKPTAIPARPGWKVAVATTFVPRGESIEMLERTVRALVALDYPHDTWVLDEGDDGAVKNLCAQLGAKYFSRKLRPEYQAENGLFKSHSKHGNYNAWFHAIGFKRYEIISTFDPDHVPHPTYLSRVLGYFNYPNVAYVQTAQAYYNQSVSFIARGAAEETYAYYSTVQMASYGMGYPVIVGSHNSHRVSALKAVGGFPCHDAEDILLTLKYRALGRQGVYVPQILARGLTPVDWSGYLTQQRRWARSVLDIKWRLFPRLSKTGLPLKTRLVSFMHGFGYVYRSIFVFTLLVTGIFMVGTGGLAEVTDFSTLWRLAGLYGVLQLCEFYRQRFFLDPKSEWGFHWRAAVLHLAKWPYHLCAVCDVISGRQKGYTLTPKVALVSHGSMLLRPNLIVAISFVDALIFRAAFGGAIHRTVGVLVISVVIVCVILIWTERLNFPPPYSASSFLRDSGSH